MYDPLRHEPLGGSQWRDAGARDAVAAICDDVVTAFAGGRLCPLHPGDDEPGTPADGVLRGLYVGAARCSTGSGGSTDRIYAEPAPTDTFADHMGRFYARRYAFPPMVEIGRAHV